MSTNALALAVRLPTQASWRVLSAVRAFPLERVHTLVSLSQDETPVLTFLDREGVTQTTDGESWTYSRTLGNGVYAATWSTPDVIITLWYAEDVDISSLQSPIANMPLSASNVVPHYNGLKVFVGDQELSGLVRVVSGFNTQLDISAGEAVINVQPGAGAGRFVECGDSAFVRTIGEATPDARGNVNIRSADGCHFVEPSYVFQTLQPGVVHINNKCLPCCTCSEAEAAFEAARQHQLRLTSLGRKAAAIAQKIATAADNIRDACGAGVAGAIAVKAYRVVIQEVNGVPDPPTTFIQVAISLCNTDDECTPEDFTSLELLVSATNFSILTTQTQPSTININGQPGQSVVLARNGARYILPIPRPIGPGNSIVYNLNFRVNDFSGQPTAVKTTLYGRPPITVFDTLIATSENLAVLT